METKVSNRSLLEEGPAAMVSLRRAVVSVFAVGGTVRVRLGSKTLWEPDQQRYRCRVRLRLLKIS